MKEVAVGVAKLAIKVAVGVGVSKVVSDVIANNVNIEDTEDQIKVMIGSFIIGAMIADQATGYVDNTFAMISKRWKNPLTDPDKTLVVVVEDPA